MKSSPAKKNPSRRNPEKTRAKILACATKSFAKGGLKGTTLTDILEKAKVNKRMVYHYYGSKEGLYRAVHIHQWQVLAEWFAQTLTSQGAQEKNSQNLLLKAVEIFHDYIATHQDFVRLSMWDGLEGGKVSRSIWDEIRGPIYRQMEALVQSAQDQGLMPGDLKVNHLIVSFMGAISFYFAYAHSLENIFDKDPLTAGAVAERKKQTMALFEKILKIPKK